MSIAITVLVAWLIIGNIATVIMAIVLYRKFKNMPYEHRDADIEELRREIHEELYSDRKVHHNIQGITDHSDCNVDLFECFSGPMYVIQDIYFLEKRALYQHKINIKYGIPSSQIISSDQRVVPILVNADILSTVISYLTYDCRISPKTTKFIKKIVLIPYHQTVNDVDEDVQSVYARSYNYTDKTCLVRMVKLNLGNPTTKASVATLLVSAEDMKFRDFRSIEPRDALLSEFGIRLYTELSIALRNIETTEKLVDMFPLY